MNSKPPTIPFGVVACTLSDNLSRSSCIHVVVQVYPWINLNRNTYICSVKIRTLSNSDKQKKIMLCIMFSFLGAMMFPQMVGPGVLIAQSGLRPNGLVEARHTGLPFVTHAVQQTVVSSSLTPSMNKLKISLENPQVLKKQVNAEKRDQSAQTVECIGRPSHDSHGRSKTASVSNRRFLVDLYRGTACENADVNKNVTPTTLLLFNEQWIILHCTYRRLLCFM